MMLVLYDSRHAIIRVKAIKLISIKILVHILMVSSS